jgi:hypothetical protein
LVLTFGDSGGCLPLEREGSVDGRLGSRKKLGFFSWPFVIVGGLAVCWCRLEDGKANCLPQGQARYGRAGVRAAVGGAEFAGWRVG